MKKTVLVLLLVLALVLGTVGMAEEANAGLIGEWVMTEMTGDGAETWADVEDVRLVFTETELTQTIVWDDDVDSMTVSYVVEGSDIMAGDVTLSFALDGDTLTIFKGFRSGSKSADMVFARVGASVPVSEDVSALLGKWSLDSKRNLSMVAGVKGYFVFAETEVTIVDESYGDAESVTLAYTVENGQIIIDGVAMAYAIEGDVLLLTDEDPYGDEVTIMLDRVQEEEPTIIGEWNVVKITGNDEMNGYLELIKAMAGKMTITFTENELTLMIYFAGESQTASVGYTIEGDQIITEGSSLSFTLEGNRLLLVNEGAEMTLLRVEQEAAEEPAEEETYADARRSDSLIGQWTLMGMTGSEEAEQMWALMNNMGATIDLTITETGVEMAMQFMGEVETESTECIIEDNKAIATDGSVILTLEDGLVKMTEDGITMVFQAK